LRERITPHSLRPERPGPRSQGGFKSRNLENKK
jgi:hypothetical protein